MIKLLKDKIWAFLFDPAVALVSIRSFFGFLASAALVIIGSASDASGKINMDVIKAWDRDAWLVRIGVAFAMGVVFRIRGGDKNPTPEKLAQMVEEGKLSLAAKIPPQ